jgi:hypothetical protein
MNMNPSPWPAPSQGPASRIPFDPESGLYVLGHESMRHGSRVIAGLPIGEEHEFVVLGSYADDFTGEEVVLDFQHTGKKRLRRLREVLAEAGTLEFRSGALLPAEIRPAAHARLRDVWFREESWRPFANNCQHVAREIVYGKRENPTTQKVVVISAVAAIATIYGGGRSAASQTARPQAAAPSLSAPDFPILPEGSPFRTRRVEPTPAKVR